MRTTFSIAIWLTIACISAAAYSQSANLDFMSISGFTEPYRSIDVAATEMGTISHVEVKEGQPIKSGDILARLNEDIHEASLGMAREKLESKGRLHSAQADLKMQQDRFTKLVGLFQRGNASQIEVNRAKSQLDVAAANVESVEDDLRIAVFEHKRASAQLELRRLRSPIDGVVTRVHKETGEFVSASDPVVVSVVQLNPLKSIFSVPQNISGRLRAGDEVNILVGSDRARTSGVVEFVSPTTDAQSGTRRVSIKIENANGQWLSGDVCVLQIDNQNNGLQQTADLQLPTDADFRLVKVKEEK